MPTFNQLVRKGRQTSVKKSTAPALQRSFNSPEESQSTLLLHRSVVYVQLLRQLLLKKPNSALRKRSPEFVFQTESK